MSWLAPTTADEDLVRRLEQRHPALFRLALVLGPALRIEPPLLRNARRRFLPRSEAGLASALWFSSLVGSRSVRALRLRPGVARLLTDRLDAPASPFAGEQVWHFIETQTRHWPFEDRLEQALRQVARQGDATRLREGLRAALRRIAGAGGDEERRDLARWAKGALPAWRLTDRPSAELDLVARFAAATRGDLGGTLGRYLTGRGPVPEWLRAPPPPGQVHRLGLRLWPGVLGDRLGLAIRLPTEWEWERAARGTDGREYPWGDGYRAGYANIDETVIKVAPTSLRQTTAVGLYPHGAPAEGVLDLAGNAWEWCLNEYGDPKRSESGGTGSRVVRAGSWFDFQHFARAPYRYDSVPHGHYDYLGFRVLSPFPIH